MWPLPLKCFPLLAKDYLVRLLARQLFPPTILLGATLFLRAHLHWPDRLARVSRPRANFATCLLSPFSATLFFFFFFIHFFRISFLPLFIPSFLCFLRPISSPPIFLIEWTRASIIIGGSCVVGPGLFARVHRLLGSWEQSQECWTRCSCSPGSWVRAT